VITQSLHLFFVAIYYTTSAFTLPCYSLLLGIDDGYWKGEADGVQGLFPSIVVEEVDMPPPSTASDTQQVRLGNSGSITNSLALL